MESFAVANEPLLRLLSFAAVLAVMVVWEIVSPRRARTLPRRRRWPANLGIAALNTAIVRILFPVAGVAIALLGESSGSGLLNHHHLPVWMAVVAGVVLLDLAIYLQHVVFHAVPALWRLHRVHHADLDIDLTTGARFHPLEIILSMLIKLAAIFTLGVPAIGVLAFELLLNAAALFNHANVHIPSKLETVLRHLIVTPDMHRIHHSVARDETNANFGFNLSLWDRIFGTYRAQPRAGQVNMIVGIPEFRDAVRCDRVFGMLTIPFLGGSAAPIGPRDTRHRERQKAPTDTTHADRSGPATGVR